MEGERQEETGFQKLLLAVILVNMGETRGHCVSPLTPVESEPGLVCSTRGCVKR